MDKAGTQQALLILQTVHCEVELLRALFDRAGSVPSPHAAAAAEDVAGCIGANLDNLVQFIRGAPPEPES